MRKYYPSGKRIIRRLLLIPLIINGEWRWLELARIEQELNHEMKWQNTKWINT
jgi:hypothetical protein